MFTAVSSANDNATTLCGDFCRSRHIRYSALCARRLRRSGPNIIRHRRPQGTARSAWRANAYCPDNGHGIWSRGASVDWGIQRYLSAGC